MPYFDWTEGLDVGVNDMNGEHKKLIDIMNKLHAKNVAGASKQELGIIIKELADYTVGHFQREEAYMAKVQFPGIDNHKIMHQNLLKKFGTHVEAFNSGDGKVPDAFFQFLKTWLSTHIRGIDIKYGEHTKSLKKAA